MFELIVILSLFATAGGLTFYPEIAEAVGTLKDSAASRLEPLKTRMARAWADLKLGVSQKVAASGRLLKLLGRGLVTSVVVLVALAVFGPLLMLGVAAKVLGWAVSPVACVLGGTWTCFRDGVEQGRDRVESALSGLLEVADRRLSR